MKRINTIFLLIGIFVLPLIGQKVIDVPKVQDVDIAKEFSKLIKASTMEKHLKILASDEMEGRETGTPGQQKAAAYLAKELASLGFEPPIENSYYQNIAFAYSRWNELTMDVNNNKYRYMWDFYAFPSSNVHQPEINSNEVLFLGYGIDDPKYSDYKGVNVKDKVIMIYQGEPMGKDSVSHITGERSYSPWTLDWKKKLETAKRKGVKAIIFIEQDVKKKVSRYRDRLIKGSIDIGEDAMGMDENFSNSVYVSTKVAKDIIGKKYYKKFIKARNKIRKTGKPKSILLPAGVKFKMDKELNVIIGENVLGFLEGTDPKLKNEIVVVSAHYDHLGKRGDDIYNGADDNGSGSSMVLNLAEAFKKAKEEQLGPKRSILFIWVSGEEKGLLGSEYYVKHPVYPLENTIVDVNVDMVGRVDEKHKDNPNYIYVIGADRLSTELHDINENANKKYTQLELDYTFNEEDDPNRYYYRSDHYNFAEKGIPAIFYFSGVHDDYHRTSDTVEKIQFDKMEKIGKLIFHTVWQLANQEKTIEVDVKQKDN